MKKTAIIAAPLLALALNACGSGFYGPPRPVRLSHIDGHLQTGQFICSPSGALVLENGGMPNTESGANLEINFSARVCASLREQSSKVKAQEMVNSGVTLVRSRCNDFFIAKQTNQGRARLIRSLIQPLTIAVTSTFAVINFGSEQRESDALALLGAGSALTTAGLNIYEDQFLFGADNVMSVQAMTMRALSAHNSDIERADLKSFDSGVRALIDHQTICNPGNILELVRASIDKGTFVARNRQPEQPRVQTGDDPEPADGTSDEGKIELTLPPVG